MVTKRPIGETILGISILILLGLIVGVMLCD